MVQITITSDDVLSVQDAAAKLGKDRKTMYRWIESGRCVSVVLGGVKFVPASEIDRLKKLEASTSIVENEDAPAETGA